MANESASHLTKNARRFLLVSSSVRFLKFVEEISKSLLSPLKKGIILQKKTSDISEKRLDYLGCVLLTRNLSCGLIVSYVGIELFFS